MQIAGREPRGSKQYTLYRPPYTIASVLLAATQNMVPARLPGMSKHVLRRRVGWVGKSTDSMMQLVVTGHVSKASLIAHVHAPQERTTAVQGRAPALAPHGQFAGIRHPSCGHMPCSPEGSRSKVCSSVSTLHCSATGVQYGQRTSNIWPAHPNLISLICVAPVPVVNSDHLHVLYTHKDMLG